MNVFILLSLFISILSQQSKTIGYQLHSINDLREWNQFLKKGMVWLKVDLYYMNYEFCNKWNQDLTDKRGCFLLTHDRPFLRNKNYNSSIELFHLVSKIPKNLYIALCFKPESFNPCENSIDARNWQSLVDDIFTVTRRIVQTEFFLDGGGKADKPSLSCLIHKWRPMKSMWIKNPEQALFSNDFDLGYDRFQIVNQKEGPESNPGERIRFLQNHNFGKFKNSTYPYVLWEPSDQHLILNISGEYMRYYPRFIHEPGFLFSINLDPIQFEIYSGIRSGVALNHALSINSRDPFVIVLDHISPVGLLFYLKGKNIYSIFKFENAVPRIEEIDLNPIVLGSSLKIKDVSKYIIGDQAFIVISDGIKNVEVYHFNDNRLILKSRTEILGRNYILKPINMNGDILFILFESTSTCQLECRFQNKKICLVKDQEVENFAFDNINDKGIVFYSSKKNIYSCYFNILEMNIKCSKKRNDVGNLPKVSMIESEKEIYLLETHTDGYCYNSISV